MHVDVRKRTCNVTWPSRWCPLLPHGSGIDPTVALALCLRFVEGHLDIALAWPLALGLGQAQGLTLALGSTGIALHLGLSRPLG